jgi:hypothetical protein
MLLRPLKLASIVKFYSGRLERGDQLQLEEGGSTSILWQSTPHLGSKLFLDVQTLLYPTTMDSMLKIRQ